MNASPRHLIDLIGLDRDWVLARFAEADRLRAARGTARAPRPMAGRTAALVFHKPSLRTRVSFTVGMHELGGDVVDLSAVEVSETGRESLPDVARVLSSMVDLIVVRTFAHRIVRTLADHSSVPIINALTDFSHPCQVLSDLYTLWRNGRDLDALTIAWVGDGNNVLHSWLEAATLFGFTLQIGVPDGFEPDAGLFLEAERRGRLRRVRDPREAVRGADVVYTDTWTSMGHEADADWRRVAFAGYQVNDSLMALANPGALFMHCLPAHRGEEVTDSVMDGARSIVVEQAENRLHLQKALMVALAAAGAERATRSTGKAIASGPRALTPRVATRRAARVVEAVAASR
ncbi:MAG: ornithine carbamoyltransferase [Candidatus Eisenbacteria bacterium]|uniref:Ornithine carbamoyltransferase n=1 Tax=Eiseniibacteriota bacterium TaxID=2212470 RepID=A0A849STG2_UNCEI|nr:ornithine carbamoyltransferase [Candidatus Eisenbacteria bacterium]